MGIFITLGLNQRTTTTTTTVAITMLNHDMMSGGVQAQEQVLGQRCCPGDQDGCKSHKANQLDIIPSPEWGGTYCDGKNRFNEERLPNGIVCKPRIGGHCCSDKTSKNYHWQYVWVRGH